MSELEHNSQSSEITIRENLCRCPECSGDLVYPEEVGFEIFGVASVHLTCPECDFESVGLRPIEDVKRLQKTNLEAKAGLELYADMLGEIIFKEEANAFIDALRADNILPEDF